MAETPLFEDEIKQSEKLVASLLEVDASLEKVIITHKGLKFVEPKNIADLEKMSKVVNEVKTAEEGRAIVSKNLSVEQQKIKVLTEAQNKANKEAARDQLGLVGAYQKTSAQLNTLRTQYKNLAVQNQANTKEAKALLVQITALDSKLKQVDA